MTVDGKTKRRNPREYNIKTCGVKDCPDTHPEIRGCLCEIYYPYGGSRCRKHFQRWLQTESRVKELDEEYRKEKSNENSTL